MIKRERTSGPPAMNPLRRVDGSTEQPGDHDDSGCQNQSPDIVRNHGSEHEIAGIGPPVLSEALLAGLPGPTEFDSPKRQGGESESERQPVSALDCEKDHKTIVRNLGSRCFQLREPLALLRAEEEVNENCRSFRVGSCSVARI